MPEKLPLPREWYSDWDRDGAADTNGGALKSANSGAAGGTDVDESSESCGVFCRAPLYIISMVHNHSPSYSACSDSAASEANFLPLS